MATGLIQQAQIDGGLVYNIASTAFGICNTAANVAAKTATLDGFVLLAGTTVYIKFVYNNTASSPTLNINSTGARDIVLPDDDPAGTNDETSGWYAGSILMLTYDGTNWVREAGYNTNNKVEQSITSTNGDFPVIFKYNNNTTDEIAQVRYTGDISINPSTGILTATGFVGSGAGLTDIVPDLSAIPNGSITNAMLANSTFTVAERTWNLGDTITAATLRSDLGLSNAMHFIGVVANNSQYTPSDGNNGVPTINGLSSYVPTAGDVIIDKDNAREYVYTSASAWELLGQDASTAYSVSLSAYERITNISQATDRTITITKATIDTLPILYGGTGTNSFTADQVILSSNPGSGETMELISRAYKDATQATPILNSTNSFLTERSIYHGLPIINNVHNYDSSTELFAPIQAGVENHILLSGGNTYVPVWSTTAMIIGSTSNVADVAAYDILSLGNDKNITTTQYHAQGVVRLYSAGTTYTEIKSQSGETETFYLPAYDDDMYAVHVGSNSAVGTLEHPVYIAANGRATATTYSLSATVDGGTANRMAYYTGANEIAATDHYANASKLGINYTTGEPTVNLYVNGTTYFNGNVTHNGITYFANDTIYYIDNSAIGYLADLRVDKIRLDDTILGFYSDDNMANNTRYGYIQVEDNTYMYFRKENGNSGFNFNGDLVPSVTDTHSIGTSALRWENIYLNGNLVMQDMGTLSSYPTVGNKITWSGDGDGVELYYAVYDSGEGTFVINTTNDTNCLISMSYNGVSKMYFNNSTPSFYPTITNTGTLGTDTNRWSAAYIGTADTYGDAYTPIYWNDGVPTATAPVQYFTWIISSGNKGVTLTGTNIFTADTYNVTLVVTSGEESLNGPLTWTSTANTFTIESTAAVSAAVAGYAIVARGVDITTSLTPTQIPVPAST